MKEPFIRKMASIVALVLLGIYVWLSVRQDPKLTSAGIIPIEIARFMDLNPRFRQFPAFMLIGAITPLCVFGLHRVWSYSALGIVITFPFLKDALQGLLSYRHFDWIAVLYGTLGVSFGWLVVIGLLTIFDLRYNRTVQNLDD